MEPSQEADHIAVAIVIIPACMRTLRLSKFR